MKQSPLHLIIVSYPSRLDATLEEIAHTLARGVTERRVVERAQAHSDLRFLVRLWHLRHRAVERLDLIGHGGPGRFKLGDELLVSDDKGLEALSAVSPFLAPRATVRLLGCGVARGPRERPDLNVLRRVAAALGPGHRVLSTTRTLFTIDYRPSGLRPSAARSLVCSPTPKRRSKHGNA